MATTNSISQQLLDLLVTRNYHPEMLDKMGRPSDAEDAKTFTFDYVSDAGKNYGTMVIVLDSDNEMKIMYGDNLGRTMEGDDKSEFFDFVQHLSQKARANRYTHSIADISQLKYTMQGMAAIQEGLFEGYYGTRKVSYAGEPTQARLQIVHSQPLGEGDARHRHIDRIFIETVDGERFKLGFKSLSGARAMLEHVRQGGRPYDIRGCHISETVNEIAVLSRFNRASATRIVEGVTEELITQAQTYYQTLRENLKHMASSRGYSKYFESWHPATITEQEGVVDNIKTLFIEQSIDSRIEAALPLLARIQQRGKEMKEADIFESWINRLAEGTWTLPETPEQLDKLKKLMAKELIVGPDAVNATEQLYDLVGDDELFDRLHELADQDPRANAFNDTEVMNRLRELGIELPEPAAPVDPAEPATNAAAPVVPATAPAPQQPVAEDDNPTTFESTLDTMRKAAGVPILKAALLSAGGAAFDKFNESVLTDSTGHTMDHILKRFSKEVANFKENGDLDNDLYDALYDYYFDDMPYGTKKARDGDPYEYVSDRLADDLGMNEGAAVDAYMAGKSPALAHFADQLDNRADVKEGSCNMTMEGEYCPEHGLAECAMEEMSTVAGMMAPVIEQKDRKAEFDYYQRAHGKPHPDSATEESRSPLAGHRDDSYSHMGPERALDFTQADTSSGVLANIHMMYKMAQNGMGVSHYIQSLQKLEPSVLNGGDPRVQKPYKFIMDKARAGELKDPKMVMQVMDQASKMMGYDNIAQDTRESKHDDPMNHNAAITGSYYESKEGDVTLARIKSLALLK